MKAIFISVRSASSRLPNKAYKKIDDNQTTIEYLIQRIKKSVNADKIVLCTTTKSADDALCDIAKSNGVDYFRGSEDDKLSRWLGAAKQFNVDFIVNADGDDLFYDPQLADFCFEQYDKTNADFIDGSGLYIDIYGIKTSALEKVCSEKKSDQTEFISPFFYKLSDELNVERLKEVPKKWKKLKIRMTLDYEEDLIFFKETITHMKNSKIQQDYENILDFLLKNPYIIDINWHRETDWTDNQNKTIKTLKQII